MEIGNNQCVGAGAVPPAPEAKWVVAEVYLIPVTSLLDMFNWAVLRLTVGVIKICALVFRELLSLGCIKIQYLCAHQQEELLMIPKHLQLVKIG